MTGERHNQSSGKVKDLKGSFMTLSPNNTKSIQAWAFGAVIPAVYLILELGFNHRLIAIASNPLNQEAISGLEFWGRILSGFGFGLFVFRLALRTRIPRGSLLVMSLATGILVMWNVQVALADYLVRSATEDDKSAALVLHHISSRIPGDEISTLKGESIVTPAMSIFETNSMRILFPAASLHVENRAHQLASWTTHISAGETAPLLTSLSADDAYRNTVILPIALGLSILFAMLNLSVLIVFLFGHVSNRSRLALNVGVFSLLVTLSSLSGNGFLRSEGYLGSMKAGIWHEKPLLALLVEWSGAAPEFWSDVSSVVADKLLFNFDFRKPMIDF